MRRQLRVGLLIQSSLEYGRGLLRGIARYMSEHESWAIYHRPGVLFDALPPRFREWGPEGIIAQLESPKLVRQIRRMKVPAVDLFALHAIPGIPRLTSDHRAVVRMVVEDFLARRYESFAYCGLPGVHYSEIRCKHFVELLGRAGYEVAVYEASRFAGTHGVFDREAAGLLETRRLGRWIADLPKPLALLAGSDLRAQQVVGACRQFEISVPGDVAVMGVGNDELICRLSNPSLSSVALNSERIGYEAAVMLERMLRGRAAPQRPILVEPRGIVARKSTGALAIADGDVAAAVQFIREHVAERVTTTEVAEHVALSRSTLQRRFAAALGRSPRDEILRAQLDRVRQLLIDTDLPLARVAELAGFHYVESMCRLFKRRLGLTPGQFRKGAAPHD